MDQKALILIDYNNDICHKDGKLAGCYTMLAENNIIEKVNNLIRYARLHKILLIWINVVFDENYLLANSNSKIFSNAKRLNALKRGTWGSEILDTLDYQVNDILIEKHAVNPFYATSLDHVLKINNINEIYVAGVSTEIAVQSCARDAHDRGYKVNVIADCCASRNIEYHNNSLEIINIFANVVTSDYILNS